MDQWTNGPMDKWTYGPQDIPKISTRYSQDIPKTLPRYLQDIPKISPRYPQDIPKISPRYPQGIPMIYTRYPQDIPNISPRYPWDIPQIFKTLKSKCVTDGMGWMDPWIIWLLEHRRAVIIKIFFRSCLCALQALVWRIYIFWYIYILDI